MTDKNLLKLLSTKFKNKREANAEIVNLRAILALPKGTEYFLSDLHGEHEAFVHMVKSASGVIRSKIDEIFGADMTEEERYDLAALIYNPMAEIKRKKPVVEDWDQWCFIQIYRVVEILKSVSTKYTRSKVRKLLPKDWSYAIDELMHADDEENKTSYYNEIIRSIVESGLTEEFICDLAESASVLAVDQLHIIGDIWDRGAHPDEIMEYLMQYDGIDFQWGNHDVVWMGAATGSWACITNVLRMNISYNNFDMLEFGYGINLRALASFAQETYADDPCEFFMPKILDENRFDPVDPMLAAKMHKAIAICQFKVEGQRIMDHPDYHIENRMMLDKIDYEKGTITLKGVEYELRDKNLPTVDPENPYKLTEGEELLMRALEASFLKSPRLQSHINFIYTKGALYKKLNGNLLFHGCIPMYEDGTLEEVEIHGKKLKGEALMAYLDDQLRKAYFNPDQMDGTGHPGDLMWYLWLGPKSPLFGKDQMTTFERLFIADKTTHKEHTVPYYTCINDKEKVEHLLAEFGLDPATSHVLCGHVPVKIKDGESPVKGGGKLIIIDGGISKAYQKTTGIAGYTYIYNSRFTALAEHKPYSPLQEDGTQQFHAPVLRTLEVFPKRYMVRDTDQAAELNKQIDQLRDLVEAYKNGEIKEVY